MRSAIDPILPIIVGSIIYAVVSNALNKHKKRTEEIKESLKA